MADQPPRVPRQTDKRKSSLTNKKQWKFPTFREEQRHLSGVEELDSFRRGYSPSKDLFPRGLVGAFLPPISPTLSISPRPSQSRGHRSFPQGLETFPAISPAQQSGTRSPDEAVAHQIQQVMAPLTWEGDDSDDDLDYFFIKSLGLPKSSVKLNANKRYWEQEVENPNKFGKQCPRNLDVDPSTTTGSHHHDCFNKDESRSEDMLDPLYNNEFWEWDDEFKSLNITDDMECTFDIDCECLSGYKESCKKIDLPFEFRYLNSQKKAKKDTRHKVQTSKIKQKLPKPHDAHESHRERNEDGSSQMKTQQEKNRGNQKHLPDHKASLQIQGRSVSKPDILENLYGAVAFKDFIISKGYSMPGVLEKLFTRKGWDYASITTPTLREVKAQELIMQQLRDAEKEAEKELQNCDLDGAYRHLWTRSRSNL
uniref:putative protein FAM47D n=1 Tax=Jaculus jaculus TaxID=51337 RepID=UPI0003333EFE|nr:putative protein FAM47D [Jaculus jaculus]